MSLLCAAISPISPHCSVHTGIDVLLPYLPDVFPLIVHMKFPHTILHRCEDCMMVFYPIHRVWKLIDDASLQSLQLMHWDHLSTGDNYRVGNATSQHCHVEP